MLGLEEDRVKMDNSPVPAMSMKQAELIDKIKKEEEAQAKKGVSLVVVGMSGACHPSKLSLTQHHCHRTC